MGTRGDVRGDVRPSEEGPRAAVGSSRLPGPAPSPAAERARRSRWRDPRLAVGVVVVAVCGLLGARLVSGASQTVDVWALGGSLRAGQPVTGADLVSRAVRFGDQADADRYLSATSQLPQGRVLSRDVGAGELLPRSALQARPTEPTTQVPVSVDDDAVPSTVSVGSLVDVWVTPDRTAATSSGSGPLRSDLVFSGVPVLSLPRDGSSLGPSSTRQVIVGVDDVQRSGLPASIAALSTGTVLVTVER